MPTIEEIAANQLKDFTNTLENEDLFLSKGDVETVLVMSKLEPSGNSIQNGLKHLGAELATKRKEYCEVLKSLQKFFAMDMRKLFADHPNLAAFRWVQYANWRCQMKTQMRPAIYLRTDEAPPAEHDWGTGCWRPEYNCATDAELEELYATERWQLQREIMSKLMPLANGHTNFLAETFGHPSVITISKNWIFGVALAYDENNVMIDQWNFAEYG